MSHSIDTPRRGERLAEGLIVAVAVALAAVAARPYAGSWNDGSRLATVESLVDYHTFAIDDSIFVKAPPPLSPPAAGGDKGGGTPSPYPPSDRALCEHGTKDKLFIKEHFYSDKSPTPAVLMAGCYQLWQWATGTTARTAPHLFCRVLTLASSGVAFVAAVWFMYRLCRRLSLPIAARFLVTASFALATVALPYARQVNNHILLLAVVSALALGVAELNEGQASWRRFAMLGFLAGLGYTIDLGAGPVIMLCTGCMVFVPARSASKGEEISCLHCGLVKRVFAFALAALPWLVLHHVLNYEIGGTFKPANANPEYFNWPGSPFPPAKLTGSWIHPNVGSFLLYAASMLMGKRGFFGHNLPLFLTIPALVVLLRRHREIRREVLWAAGCFLGTWLLYAAASNNSSGQCCTIRWFVPLLAPVYFILALFLQRYPRYRLDLLILSIWGALLVSMMGEGPWMGGMVRFFWPIQVAALSSWALCHYLRRRNRADIRPNLTTWTFAVSRGTALPASPAMPPHTI